MNITDIWTGMKSMHIYLIGVFFRQKTEMSIHFCFQFSYDSASSGAVIIKLLRIIQIHQKASLEPPNLQNNFPASRDFTDPYHVGSTESLRSHSIHHYFYMCNKLT